MRKPRIFLVLLFVTMCTFPLLHPQVERTSGRLTKFSSKEEVVWFLQNKRLSASYGSGQKPQREMLTPSTKEPTPEGSSDCSDTNTQVGGVDEADTVKTDGEYIYMISGSVVLIVKAFPAEEAQVMSRLRVNGTPGSLYIRGRRLVVINEYSGWVFTGRYSPRSVKETFISVYDVSNRSSPVLKRTVTVGGSCFSSRMIGEYVYVIIKKAADVINETVDLPQVRSGNSSWEVDATDVYHSDVVDYGYCFSTIVSVDVRNETKEPRLKTILTGWATSTYVSRDNIYLAMTYGDETFLHRIHIEEGEIQEAVEGSVDGYVLNQFSMDEHNGYFRIATTQGWDRTLKSNLYVLSSDMKVVGSLEGLAPRESIHSVRFMGDIGYVVTFRKVDPFFVVDLSSPSRPRILGELKVSGYSDYLHVYDQNNIIGVGKETAAANEGDFSWYQGVKISLFNVEDAIHPTELAKYEIGDRGTDSPALRDHKALLFDKEKRLLVIPVSLAVINESRYSHSVSSNTLGDFVWQGAYVFSVSLEAEEKIVLRGTITHIRKGAISDQAHHITRTLYVGDVLYTISQHIIMMNSLVDMSAVNELELSP